MTIHRDRLLAESDWVMMPDAPTDKTAWAAYRQQLRDFPLTWTPGPVADFPLAPGETAVESVSESEQSAEVPVEEGPSDDISNSSSSAHPG